MDSLLIPRPLLLLLSGFLFPVLFTQCKMTGGGTYRDVSYDPAKLKTPPGHGMERKDYPFDESGAYRKDWVKSNSRGKDGSAAPGATSPAHTTEVAAAETAGSTSYPTYAEASAGRSGSDVVTPSGEAGPVELAQAGLSDSSSTAPAQVAARYHKVSSGDTLFSLASRYQTSVADLKRINGLSGDSIRVGQSLRLP